MTATMTRTFNDLPAVREKVPLLIGLTGPSGSGKTYSALRLAMGIRAVVGGDVFGIDTEADRMKHYADTFRFRHVPFKAPFGSLDYLSALEYCVAKGAKTIIVDSTSHEHEGPGGMLDFQDAEVERLSRGDAEKRDKVKMLAWVKPKGARRQLINGLLQLNANFIFCFRAKNVSKPVKFQGKTEVIPQGFIAIAGDDFIYEMTVNCLLLPKSGGVPTWHSENPGESMAMKLPEQFKGTFASREPLSEKIGQQLAEWAQGKPADNARLAADDRVAKAYRLAFDAGLVVEQSVRAYLRTTFAVDNRSSLTTDQLVRLAEWLESFRTVTEPTTPAAPTTADSSAAEQLFAEERGDAYDDDLKTPAMQEGR